MAADVEGWPFRFAVYQPEGVEHTAEAFAAWLSEEYDTRSIQLLREVWANHPVRQAWPAEHMERMRAWMESRERHNYDNESTHDDGEGPGL